MTNKFRVNQRAAWSSCGNMIGLMVAVLECRERKYPRPYQSYARQRFVPRRPQSRRLATRHALLVMDGARL